MKTNVQRRMPICLVQSFAWTTMVLCLAAALVLSSQPVKAETLADVKERGVLRVGVTQAPPWYSKDLSSGNWTSGLGVFMGKAMAESIGVEFEPVEVTWGTAIAALQSGKIDLMYMLDATDERKKAVSFPTSPLLYYSLAVLARDDLDVTTWEDLNDSAVSIALPQASSMDKFVSELAPNANIQRFPGNQESIAAFQAGRVDAVSLFHPPLLAARSKLGKGKIIVPTPALSRPSSVAVRTEESSAFVDWVDASIAGYYADGKTQQWYEDSLAEFGLDGSTAPPVMKELFEK
jgi:polar amino acid transport system substrate-binding protein